MILTLIGSPKNLNDFFDKDGNLVYKLEYSKHKPEIKLRNHENKIVGKIKYYSKNDREMMSFFPKYTLSVKKQYLDLDVKEKRLNIVYTIRNKDWKIKTVKKEHFKKGVEPETSQTFLEATKNFIEIENSNKETIFIMRRAAWGGHVIYNIFINDNEETELEYFILIMIAILIDKLKKMP